MTSQQAEIDEEVPTPLERPLGASHGSRSSHGSRETEQESSHFDRAVEEVLLGLAAGEVVTYGWVAVEAGYPGRHRGVGNFLANRFRGPNWWLVVGSDRRLHAPNTIEQEARLRADGVTVDAGRVLSAVKRPGR